MLSQSVTLARHAEEKRVTRKQLLTNGHPSLGAIFLQALDLMGFAKTGTAPAISQVQQKQKNMQ